MGKSFQILLPFFISCSILRIFSRRRLPKHPTPVPFRDRIHSSLVPKGEFLCFLPVQATIRYSTVYFYRPCRSLRHAIRASSSIEKSRPPSARGGLSFFRYPDPVGRPLPPTPLQLSNCYDTMSEIKLFVTRIVVLSFPHVPPLQQITTKHQFRISTDPSCRRRQIPKGGQVMDPGLLCPSVTLSPSHFTNTKVRIPTQSSTSKVYNFFKVPKFSLHHAVFPNKPLSLPVSFSLCFPAPRVSL